MKAKHQCILNKNKQKLKNKSHLPKDSHTRLQISDDMKHETPGGKAASHQRLRRVNTAPKGAQWEPTLHGASRSHRAFGSQGPQVTDTVTSHGRQKAHHDRKLEGGLTNSEPPASCERESCVTANIPSMLVCVCEVVCDCARVSSPCSCVSLYLVYICHGDCMVVSQCVCVPVPVCDLCVYGGWCVCVGLSVCCSVYRGH